MEKHRDLIKQKKKKELQIDLTHHYLRIEPKKNQMVRSRNYQKISRDHIKRGLEKQHIRHLLRESRKEEHERASNRTMSSEEAQQWH